MRGGFLPQTRFVEFNWWSKYALVLFGFKNWDELTMNDDANNPQPKMIKRTFIGQSSPYIDLFGDIEGKLPLSLEEFFNQLAARERLFNWSKLDHQSEKISAQRLYNMIHGLCL